MRNTCSKLTAAHRVETTVQNSRGDPQIATIRLFQSISATTSHYQLTVHCIRQNHRAWRQVLHVQHARRHRTLLYAYNALLTPIIRMCEKASSLPSAVSPPPLLVPPPPPCVRSLAAAPAAAAVPRPASSAR